MMVLSLIVASCGPAEEEAEVEVGEEEVEVVEEEEEEEEEAVEEGPEVPKYGGTLTYLRTSDMSGFDPLYSLPQGTQASIEVNGYLIQGDWTKGLAGTGETDWSQGADWRIDLMTGSHGLAESWELPDDSTIIVHIREGVHYGLDPDSEASRLVNGREFTADDAVYSMARCYALETSLFASSYAVGERPESWTALDKYTVEIKTPPFMQGHNVWQCLAYSWLLPHEVEEVYGDFKDWHNLVGTGPFFLKDIVPSSSITYEKNPNYFAFDPLHPENRLPYVDTLKTLIIADLSTRLAAFRTGNIDYLMGVSWEDAESLMKTNSDLLSFKTISAPSLPWGRIDKEELPFKDIRVRRALNLAVNQQEIIDDYYQGNAIMLGIPWPPSPAYEPIYTPLDQQSPEVQELFTYNPEKAKQLLAEAGYPDGFQTEIICSSADSDFVSLIKEYFSAINVEMEIKPLEGSAYWGVMRARSHDEMIFKFLIDYMNPTNLDSVHPIRMDNPSYYQAPWVQECIDNMAPLLVSKDPELYRLLKEAGTKILESAHGVYLPAPYRYNIWWPWLQNYHGEVTVGYGGHNFMHQFLWVDPALKKSMGY